MFLPRFAPHAWLPIAVVLTALALLPGAASAQSKKAAKAPAPSPVSVNKPDGQRTNKKQESEEIERLAIAYLQQGQYDSAIAASRLAIAADPKNAAAYGVRAYAYYKKGDYATTIKDCEEAIRINPAIPAIYRYRSQAYARLGKNELAVKDYLVAVSLDPRQKDRFDFTPFVVSRQEALAALESFQLGSTVTPALLQAVNSLKGIEQIEGAEKAMSGEAKEAVGAEAKRYRALEFEMVAAADLLLRAAAMSPADREAKGMKLGWLFGPVSAPNARGGSKDGLAGLRIIGRLELPQGKVINSIFAVKFYPSEDPASPMDGKVALLSNLDNVRLEVRLFDQGTTKTDYAFQSFSVAGQGGKMTMRPGFYLDPKTGTLVNRELDAAGLGTSCINCHGNGPRVVKQGSPNLALMAEGDYQAMEGFKEFLDQIRHWSGGIDLRQKLEEKMKTQGPVALLPIDDMLKANREHWLSIYPRYVARLEALPKPTFASDSR